MHIYIYCIYTYMYIHIQIVIARAYYKLMCHYWYPSYLKPRIDVIYHDQVLSIIATFPLFVCIVVKYGHGVSVM